MARPGLMRHRKFARLARLIGSDVLARGHLELLWEVAYENGDDQVGDAGDLEHLARWTGPAGALASALVESGFFDLEGDMYRVHDLWDHAPDYVRKRRHREVERQTKGATLKSVTGQCPPSGAEQPEPAPNGRTRARAPAPSQEDSRPPPAIAARPAEAPFGKDQVLSTRYPLTAVLLDLCSKLGTHGAWPKDHETRTAVESAIGDQSLDAVAGRVSAAIADTGKPWLGHHLTAIRSVRRKPTDARTAIAAPAPHEAFGQGGERVID